MGGGGYGRRGGRYEVIGVGGGRDGRRVGRDGRGK